MQSTLNAGLNICDHLCFKGSADIEPPLTTARLPAGRIGRTAGQTLVEQIVTNGDKGRASTHIAPELIIRGSVAKIS